MSVAFDSVFYLSKKIFDASSEMEKRYLIHSIKNGSVLARQHINLQGEYDFLEETLKDFLGFNLPEFLDLQAI